MSRILDYYHSVYNELPDWVSNFHNMSEQSLENYTNFRNTILKSRYLEKFEMDYVIIAINVYRGYEDSIYMHSLAALATGGNVQEINTIVNHVKKTNSTDKEEIEQKWANVLQRLENNETIQENSLLSQEMLSIINCCIYISTLQSEWAHVHVHEYIISNYDRKKLDDGVLASLLTAGIPVMFEYTKALDEVDK